MKMCSGRAQVGRRDVGDVFDEVVERLDVQLRQRVARQRLHCDRDVLNRLFAPRRRDDDLR
jgi:hypothetical protein